MPPTSDGITMRLWWQLCASRISASSVGVGRGRRGIDGERGSEQTW